MSGQLVSEVEIHIMDARSAMSTTCSHDDDAVGNDNNENESDTNTINDNSNQEHCNGALPTD